MDPTVILNSTFQTGLLIKQIVEDVKANQQQCKRLSEKIEAINDNLQSRKGQELKRPELKKSLDNFSHCIQDCLNFVAQFKDDTWASKLWKVLKNHTYKDQFVELNARLSQCAADLNLGINLKQIFDHTLDGKDQKVDLSYIESKIDKIAEAIEKTNAQQCEQYKNNREYMKQRFQSLKYSLQQDIMKIRDPVRANEITEEGREFLHIPYYDLGLKQRIGHGGFADVYRGTWLSQHHEVAIKLIRIQYLDDTIRKDFVNEISLLHLVLA
ncbi:unnamed protein product [Rotaria magnacalcarata]